MANEEHPLNGLMSTTLEKIHEMVDSNTIIGQPINTDRGITIIPVSKVSFGFGSGGSDIPSAKVTRELFGGASGAGVTIVPIAFLVIGGDDEEVQLVQLAGTANTASQALNMIPEVVDKIADIVKGKRKDKEARMSNRPKGQVNEPKSPKGPGPKIKVENAKTVTFEEEIIDTDKN